MTLALLLAAALAGPASTAEEIRPASVQAPEQGPALRALAGAAIEAGRTNEGLALADRVVALSPAAERGAALLWRGRLRLGLGDREEARKDFSASVEADPGAPDGWAALSDMRLAEGSWDGALAAAERMAGAGRLRLRRARTLRRLARGEPAVEYADAFAALASSPAELSEAAVLRARAFLALGRASEAENVLRRALDDAPNDRALLRALLDALRRSPAKAAAALRVAACLLCPCADAPTAECPDARRARAGLLLSLGRREDLESAWLGEGLNARDEGGRRAPPDRCDELLRAGAGLRQSQPRDRR